MRKFLAVLLDSLIVISLLLAILILFFVVYIKQTNNILDLSQVIADNLNFYILASYFILLTVLVFYFVIVPLLLDSTFGQFIMGLKLAPQERKSIANVFLFYFSSIILNILLLPISLYCILFKKCLISYKLTGLKLIVFKESKFIRFLLAIFIGILPVITFSVVYRVYKDPVSVITRFIDYKKYTQRALELKDYQTISTLLENYKAKYGEDDEYFIYKCVADAHVSLNLDNIENVIKTCNKASSVAKNNNEKIEVLLAKINIYDFMKDLDQEKKLYETLWTKYNYRGIEMLNYIGILAKSDTKKAKKYLQEWESSNNVSSFNIKNIYSVAELYFDLKEYNKALNLYTLILNKAKSNAEKAGASFRIGECYYQLKNYKKAKEYFLQAKKLDDHYTNLVESYIIDMNIKGYK